MEQKNLAPLTSWKEIAAYLGKGVRTVQRWEVQLGLPVQRPNRSNHSIVRATREELDRWLAEQWSARNGNKEVAAVPNDPKEVATLIVGEEARGLRAQHRDLVTGVQASLLRLRQECEALTRNIGEGRGNGRSAAQDGQPILDELDGRRPKSE